MVINPIHLVRDTAAVFIDKDGTLVEDMPHNVDPTLIRLTPRAGDGLRLLKDAGYRFLIVSNQSGVARGLFTEDALSAVEVRLRELLLDEGVEIDGWYYCPHHPEGSVPQYALSCTCRTPAPGMIQAAAREHAVTLKTSWMVGDILDDIEAGRRAGCRTVLIDNGSETEWRSSALRVPHVRATNLLGAAHAILAADRVARITHSTPRRLHPA